MVEFPWQRGDVVLLDNVLAVHARNAFTGPRKVMTTPEIQDRKIQVSKNFPIYAAV